MEGSCPWPSVRCVAGGRGGGALLLQGRMSAGCEYEAVGGDCDSH